MELASKTAHICVTVPPDLRDRLDALAAQEERSRSYIAARAIRAYLAALERPADAETPRT
jgi:predicted transcriptional regulator